MPSHAPVHRRRKEARPQELLDAALALFVERGFAASKAEDVAARAGVSKGTLYLYYPSKEELLKAVIAHHLKAPLSAGQAVAAQYPGTVDELLRTLLVPWWLAIYDSPASGVFKLMITEARSFPEIAQFYHREFVEPAHRLLGDVIRRGIAAGEFRPVPVDHAVHSLVLPLVMVCLHRHTVGACAADWHLDGRAFIAEHVSLMLDGLRASALPTPAPADTTP